LDDPDSVWTRSSQFALSSCPVRQLLKGRP